MTNIELSTALMVTCCSSHSYATTTDLSHLTLPMSGAGHRAKTWMPDRHRVGSIGLLDDAYISAHKNPASA